MLLIVSSICMEIFVPICNIYLIMHTQIYSNKYIYAFIKIDLRVHDQINIENGIYIYTVFSILTLNVNAAPIAQHQIHCVCSYRLILLAVH